MSCEGSRGKFFEHVAEQSGGQITARQMESLYQASRRKPATPAEATMADAKTRLVFGAIQALGLKPPTHAQDGLPKTESRLGYAAVYDHLKRQNLFFVPQAAATALQQTTASAPAKVVVGATGLPLGLNGRDSDGYDRWGYDAEGFDRQGYDRQGFDRRGLDKNGVNRYGFDFHGRDAKGYDAQGFNKNGYNRRGFDKFGYRRDNVDEDGYDKEGYKDGYDRAGYDSVGKDRQGNQHPFFTTVGPDGLYLDGLDAAGFNPEGYDLYGRDRFGFNREGYNDDGFDRRGLNSRGWNADGCDPEGFDGQGFREEGGGKKRDRFGYDEDGFDLSGYTYTGYDRNGLDRNGQPRSERDRRGNIVPCKFNKSGWDKNGYDRWGFHRKDGLTAPDANGLRHNVFGWVYDDDTKECYDPQDPTRRISHAYSFYWDRSTKRVESGRRYASEPPDPGPPPITPKASMTFDEYAKTRTHYHRRYYAQRDYNEALNPDGRMDDGRMAARWQAFGRSIDDPLACHGGVLMHCPHCGQFTGAKPHTCPNFVDDDGENVSVEVHRSGIVFENGRYGRILHQPGREDFDPDYPNGYNQKGFDKDGFDRLGYNERGFDREGYSPDGFDVLGYDRDGFDREGYNREGYNRVGEKRARTLAGLANVLDPGQDLLSNQDLAMLYSQIATGLVGKPRRVVLQEGGGFGTDMRGTITADPYPMGRQADPRHNLVVTRAGIHHELGHELFTPPEVWAQVLEVAEGKQKIDGLGEAAAKLLPRFFNIVEDGRMERRLANGYAGVAEVLAASCRLEPRWHEQVGEGVPVGDQVFWALLYTSLPFFRVRSEVRNGMTPQARALFDELEPVVRQAVQGDAGDALAAAVHLARRFEEEGLIQQLPPEDYSQFVKPPPGTKPRQGQPGSGQGQPQPGDSSRQGQGSPGESGGQGGKQGDDDEEDEDQQAGAGGSGGNKGEDDAGDQAGAGSGGGEDEQEGGNQAGAGAGEDEEEDREQDAGSGGPGGAGTSTGGQEKQSGGRELGDPDQAFGDKDVEAVARSMEREVAAAIEAGVRRRSRKDTIGKPLHAPLGSRMSATQRYFSPEGAVEDTRVDLPRTDSASARDLEPRRASHKRVATDMARQLRAIREQTEQTLRRQSEGRLDRHQLVGAVKGLTDVHTRTRQMPRTSFAVSMAIDLSGSMDEHIFSGALYDATMTLGDTFDMLEMPYEVRGFGSSDAQFKAMDDPGFAPERAACLTTLDLGGTQGARAAGLAASALLARDENNKLMVVLSDGQMGDHSRAARTLQQARRDGIVTFGVFLGPGANPERMNELYGPGNWATINSLDELPTEVGRRLSALFKRMRK